MNKLKFLVLFFLIISNSSFSQLEVYIDTMKNDSPNESWNVNKSYDKDGNIIQYDSSYSYSYSSSGENLNIDSLISTFGINNFFSSPFELDSTFNFFNQRSRMIEDVFKEFIQIDSFFNDFFEDNFSQPKQKKKNTGTHI
tara:strand:- start:840 stop:1259 length:420 start_codon:yes stop_codon:yes gene_type:complete